MHIGDFEEVTMKQLAEKMFDVVHWKPSAVDIKNGPVGSVKRRLADVSKLQSLTSWKPEVSLADGLKRTYDWYLEHPDPNGEQRVI